MKATCSLNKASNFILNLLSEKIQQSQLQFNGKIRLPTPRTPRLIESSLWYAFGFCSHGWIFGGLDLNMKDAITPL